MAKLLATINTVVLTHPLMNKLNYAFKLFRLAMDSVVKLPGDSIKY